jgi:hypothetical protein
MNIQFFEKDLVKDITRTGKALLDQMMKELSEIS